MNISHRENVFEMKVKKSNSFDSDFEYTFFISFINEIG